MLDFSNYKNIERTLFYFSEIAKIPHVSGKCKEIADYLTDFAKARGLSFYRDEADNVIIKKNGTAGYENAPTVIIQGHTDMVRATDGEGYPDPETDPLSLYIDGEYLAARGTTLGADDGIAVAYALSLLESKDIPHPPIEAVFTSDEEIGLIGADKLDASALSGKMMINIDSDFEGVFIAGCAGGARVDVTKRCELSESDGVVFKLRIEGLLGGHSGSEIDKNRTNAILLLAGLIPSGSRIGELKGGNADNAIPTFAECLIVPSRPMGSEIAENLVRLWMTEPDANITLTPCYSTKMLMSAEDSDEVLDIIKAIGYGVVSRSPENSAMVESSLNQGLIDSEGGVFSLAVSVRSSVSAKKEEIIDRIAELAISCGAEYEVSGRYPGWEYKRESALRECAVAAYRRLFSREPKVISIHAGLECGIFSDKIEGLDCISLGPDMKDIHTTSERLSLPSAERTWRLLCEILASIKE